MFDDDFELDPDTGDRAVVTVCVVLLIVIGALMLVAAVFERFS